MKPLLKLIFGFSMYALSPVIIIFVMVIGIGKIIIGKQHLIENKNLKQ